MTAETLLQDLGGRGIRLIPDGDGLIVEPASRLTDEDRATIRAAKTDLLALLAKRQQQADMACPPAAPSSTVGPRVIDVMRRSREAALKDSVPSTDTVIEATFGPAATTFLYAGAEDIAPLEFPLCSGCGHRRYWLGSGGKVACSACGAVRFMIVALEFHPVN